MAITGKNIMTVGEDSDEEGGNRDVMDNEDSE